VSEYFCLFISAYMHQATRISFNKKSKRKHMHPHMPTHPSFFFWLLIVVFVAGGIKNNKEGKKNLSSYRENQEK